MNVLCRNFILSDFCQICSSFFCFFRALSVGTPTFIIEPIFDALFDPSGQRVFVFPDSLMQLFSDTPHLYKKASLPCEQGDIFFMLLPAIRSRRNT